MKNAFRSMLIGSLLDVIRLFNLQCNQSLLRINNGVILKQCDIHYDCTLFLVLIRKTESEISVSKRRSAVDISFKEKRGDRMNSP